MWVEESPFNFARTSGRDAIVHGAARPVVDEVDAWIELVLGHRIVHVLCLLAPEELAAYDDLLGRYRRRFATVAHVPLVDLEVPAKRDLERALEVLTRAERRDEPIVVHCAAGIGRTGIVTAAWLRVRYGLTVDAAIAEVRRSAEDAGAFRDPLETNELEVHTLLRTLGGPTSAPRG
jgi:protein-tyrosine phosphatase